ncbi:MAG: hypothetical protein ACAI38_13635 [Myxococcota bacterium]|nr:hypothetical protein [Myxococcota bacterium]
MAGPLFFTHEMIEQWIDDGEVLFEDDMLTIFEQNTSYKLAPAVRVTELLSGDDVHGWMGCVLSVEEAQAAGAEHFQGSLIVGDTAYQCEEGFLGAAKSVVPATPTAPADAPEAAAPVDPAKTGSSFGEPEDMLADFLLKHL